MRKAGGTNTLIDWGSGTAKARRDRRNYLWNLRAFLLEIEQAARQSGDAVDLVMKRWNVYFIDADRWPRVNLDEPKDLPTGRLKKGEGQC